MLFKLGISKMQSIVPNMKTVYFYQLKYSLVKMHLTFFDVTRQENVRYVYYHYQTRGRYLFTFTSLGVENESDRKRETLFIKFLSPPARKLNLFILFHPEYFFIIFDYSRSTALKESNSAPPYDYKSRAPPPPDLLTTTQNTLITAKGAHEGTLSSVAEDFLFSMNMEFKKLNGTEFAGIQPRSISQPIKRVSC